MKLTCKKMKFFEKDEAKAIKEYHAFGLHNLEKDERKHRRYLRKRIKERC